MERTGQLQRPERAIRTSGVGAVSAGVSVAARKGTPVVLILYIVSLILPLQLQIGPLAMPPFRLVLFFAFVPLLVGLFSGRYGKILPVDWLFMLHVLWASLSVAYNNPARALEHGGSLAVEFLGGYLLARSHIRDKESFFTLAKYLLLAITFTLPFAMVEAVTGKRVLIGIFDAIGLPTIDEIGVERRMGLARVQGPFDHPIHYGVFASLAVSLIFLGMKERLSIIWRTLGSGLAGAAVFLSLSSGAILAVVVQVMLVGWTVVTFWLKRRWMWFFILMGLGYVTIDLMSNRTPIEVIMSRATFSPHNAYYRANTNFYAWQNIMARPIFGTGLNPWQRPSWLISSIDNFWLATGVRYGIVALVLLICGYVYGVVKVGLAKLTDPDDLAIRQAWMITFGGLLLTLTTVHMWANLYSFVFCFFGSGMWLVTSPTRPPATPAEEPPEDNPRASLRYSRFAPAQGGKARSQDAAAKDARPSVRHMVHSRTRQ